MSNTLGLSCLILGIRNPSEHIFTIHIAGEDPVSFLKSLIKAESPRYPVGVVIDHADDLHLWKVSIPDNDELETTLNTIQFESDDSRLERLRPSRKLSKYFSGGVAEESIHVLVQVPAPDASGSRKRRTSEVISNEAKRLKLEPSTFEFCNAFDTETSFMPPDTILPEQSSAQVIEPSDSSTPSPPPPHTPPPENIYAQSTQKSPERLNKAQMEANMADAFEPFVQYIKYLAGGKLDGYFNSTRRQDRATDLPVIMSTDPILLLHDLGNRRDEERIKRLFVRGTTHLFNTTGSGKTRLSLEGLCEHWGFYLSCRSMPPYPSGSGDFEAATNTMMSLSTWDRGKSDKDILHNNATAKRVFTMLLCARVFVFKQLLDRIPAQTDVTIARRRWVLLQVLPALLVADSGDDIFVAILSSLRNAHKDVMLPFIRTTLRDCYTRKEFFPDVEKVNNSVPLFIVIDEAQVAADQLKAFFRSDNVTADPCPILHELYKFFHRSKIFVGIIISGTGLSTNMVTDALRSIFTKSMGENQDINIFTDTGLFRKADSSQENYIRRYLPLSDSCTSDTRLMERIRYWFSGRHRPTASIIELLLYSENVPRHRVLTAFVKHLTGFTITDAIDLEEQEGPITSDLAEKIRTYGRLGLVKRLFEEPNRQELVQCLVDVLMRWIMGSQTTSIPIEHNMHAIIGLGVGHLNAIVPQQNFDPNTNFPVYIDEPLVVLSLSSLFEMYSWTTRKKWITNSFRAARDKSALGIMFEEMALLVLMENFGGKATVLGDVFLFGQPSPIGSRMVTLVSLKQNADGTMRCCPVSWTEGCSDRIGFKANSPTDVLKFFQDPNGKAFLFPDNHMGPDLMCFVQDQETKELILLALQSKIAESLNTAAWLNAVDSITPKFFYTVMKDGKKARYAPVAYPNLSKDVEKFLKMALGPEVSAPLETAYRSKLRSWIHTQPAIASQQQRQTPRFLRIIATPDDDQKHRLTAESTGDVAVLKSDVVKGYGGSTVDIVTTKRGSVLR